MSFFTLADNNIGTRGHSKKLVKFRCTRDCCKYFFSNRVINRWNQLDQRAVEATSINAFKSSFSKIRETRMGFFMDWSAEPWASMVGFLTGEATQGEWQGEWVSTGCISTDIRTITSDVTEQRDEKLAALSHHFQHLLNSSLVHNLPVPYSPISRKTTRKYMSYSANNTDYRQTSQNITLAKSQTCDKSSKLF